MAAGRRLAKLVGSMGLLPSSDVGLSCLETQSGPQRPWGCTPWIEVRVAVVAAAAGVAPALGLSSLRKILVEGSSNASWLAWRLYPVEGFVREASLVRGRVEAWGRGRDVRWV